MAISAAEGNERVSTNIEHSGYFIRGDAISLYVINFEGYDPYANSLQIRILN